jgi:hypothetical protein
MSWSDLFGSIIEGVTGIRESSEAMGVPVWGGADAGANAQPLQANATVDRVLAGRRTELNINDR